jgi:glycosyltransferase involved in cell wall biosynthesis
MRNKYEAIYVREMMTNPTPRICSKLFGIPLYIEINDLIVPVLSENGLQSSVISKVAYQQELDYNHATGLIVPSAPMCEWIISHYNLSASKVHLILNGAEASQVRTVSQIEARKTIGIPTSSFCLGFVGNIYNRYDFDCILHAVLKSISDVPQLHLLIIGDGPLIDKVKQNVNELKLNEKTTFTGYIQPQELGGILPAIDIGLLILTEECSSRYGPITTKLSTYALSHLPVITAGTTLEGYAKELTDGLFLVPPNDPRALADMILQLFNDAEVRNSKANLLHDYAIKKLTWTSISKEIITIIKQTNTTN